ncbi:hypothetical protein [Mesorhizobium sp. CO1-1-7]|nr:hypothetical protein [Mesorhizobium sp. CO1-1-7]
MTRSAWSAPKGNSGDISFIDLENEEVVKSVPVGRGPWGVVIGP